MALAVACFVFFAAQLGLVTGAAAALLGIWLLGGFVVQIVVAIIELKEGNTTAGNVFTYFSAFFMLVLGLGMIFKFFAKVNGWEIDARIDGWGWLPLSAALTMWAPAYLKSPKTMFAVVLLLLPAVWIVTITDMGYWPKSIVPISAWCLCGAGVFAIYTSSAIVLNTQFGRTILPTGAPLVK